MKMFSGHFSKNTESLEILFSQTSPGLHLDSHDPSPGIFKNNVNLVPRLGAKVVHAGLTFAPGNLFLDFHGDEIFYVGTYQSVFHNRCSFSKISFECCLHFVIMPVDFNSSRPLLEKGSGVSIETDKKKGKIGGGGHSAMDRR
jgi:hypothetical protein